MERDPDFAWWFSVIHRNARVHACSYLSSLICSVKADSKRARNVDPWSDVLAAAVRLLMGERRHRSQADYEIRHCLMS